MAGYFACIILAGTSAVQKCWLTDFLAISAKNATGCLSLALDKAASLA